MQTQISYQQRLDTLFTDLAKIATNPRNGTKTFQSEINSIYERLQELEQQMAQFSMPMPSSNDNSRAKNIILYEQENYGYVIFGDDVKSFQDDPGIQPQQNILKAPLSASGGVIGQIQLAAEDDREWSPEEVSLANTVAQHAALQIQNLRLLATTEKARAEAESASRQFVHEGWDAYLDAIHEKEHIGYLYNQQVVLPVTDDAMMVADHKEPVTIMGVEIGMLQLQTDNKLTQNDKELIALVARQIGQQVENLRLLAVASRARQEAEQTSRQLTQENWKGYTEKLDESSRNFLYNTVEVKAVTDDEIPNDVSLAQPLTIQGVVIGQLAVSGLTTVSSEADNLAKAIAAQASIHLETLRLNEELRKRAAELQELDRLKSAFLANMSHELRTPLNSILGFADVLLEGLDGPLTLNMVNDLRRIQKNGQHLLHLINDVLDMAKIESGKMNLIIEKFNLHEIIEEVTNITSSLAGEKELALFIEEDSDREVEVNADRTRLRQVMINLVNNALKFTEKGEVTIKAIREHSNVMIKVNDTGIGVSPDHLEAVFQEFTQVDSSTTRKVGGTGLGLPISHKLIEMHNGKLWAESSGIEGQGSTFFVSIPIENQTVVSEPISRKIE